MLTVFPSSGGSALPLLGVISSVRRYSMDQVFTSSAQRRRQQVSSNLSPKSPPQLSSSLVGISALWSPPTSESPFLTLSGLPAFRMRRFTSQVTISANYSIQPIQFSSLFFPLLIPGAHPPSSLRSLTSYSQPPPPHAWSHRSSVWQLNDVRSP